MSTTEIVLPITEPETEWVRRRAVRKVSPTRDQSRLQLGLGAALMRGPADAENSARSGASASSRRVNHDGRSCPTSPSSESSGSVGCRMRISKLRLCTQKKAVALGGKRSTVTTTFCMPHHPARDRRLAREDTPRGRLRRSKGPFARRLEIISAWTRNVNQRGRRQTRRTGSGASW